MRNSSDAGQAFFLQIVDWSDYQYSDIRKKPNPPWRWCRLPTVLMSSPSFQSMTMPQRGALCSLLMLASETGNLIPDEPGFLRNRIQLDGRLRRSLIDLGVIQEIVLPLDSREVKDLRRVYSGGAPANRRTVEEEEEESRTESDAKESQSRAAAHDPGPYSGRSIDIPSPHPGARKNGSMEHVSSTLSGARRGKGKDPRSFDELKQQVLGVARKLNTADADKIHRLAGQSLKMSTKQIRVAVTQLIEDREL